jgi:hypothetical protein
MHGEKVKIVFLHVLALATTIDQGKITLQAKTQHYKNCLVVPNGLISSE